jgi:nicotinamidase-related amidase
MSNGELRFGPIGPGAVHLCVDMQRLFAEGGPWPTPWMNRVLPTVVRLVEHRPEQTVFTRFIPPRRPEDMPGVWQRYYERWRHVTLERVDHALLDLVAPLDRFVPPAGVFDKQNYSAFFSGALHRQLTERGVDTLIITGAETDVCVLATVFGGVELGYRVIVVSDAICSSSDAGHDALMLLYRERLGQQTETADCDTIMENWRA